jgi:hypothetical protein
MPLVEPAAAQDAAHATFLREVTLLRIFLSSEGLEIKGAITWPKSERRKN